jgi:hypothetical protein
MFEQEDSANVTTISRPSTGGVEYMYPDQTEVATARGQEVTRTMTLSRVGSDGTDNYNPAFQVFKIR